MFSGDSLGEYHKLGIIDSIYKHPNENPVMAIDERKNFIYSIKPDTTGHGTDVCTIAAFFAPKSLFSFYRVVIESSPFSDDLREGNLLKAISAAENHGIDVLNMSVGIHHSNCQQQCRIGDAIRSATESGVTIVAAAGNTKPDRELGLYCPALIDEAIAVGGFISRCDEEIQNTTTSGQYWAATEDDKCIGPFCGYETCPSEYPCSRNRQELYWDRNVEKLDQKPDILAPVAYPKEYNGIVTLDGGTSYATPIVSGSIARVFSELFLNGIRPNPGQIKAAIVRTGDPVQGTNIKKFNAGNTLEWLKSNR